MVGISNFDETIFTKTKSLCPLFIPLNSALADPFNWGVLERCPVTAGQADEQPNKSPSNPA